MTWSWCQRCKGIQGAVKVVGVPQLMASYGCGKHTSLESAGALQKQESCSY